MKISRRRAAHNPSLAGALIILSLLGGGLGARAATSTNAAPAYAFNFLYSTGLADVLKLVDAKVDTQVIVAYVKSASVPYNPSANELIALKQRGVPPEVLAALLQRGGEVRAQTARAQAAEQYAANVAPAAPYDESMAYGGYPTDYGYPYDYGYAAGYYNWPGWWYSGWPGYWPNWNFGSFHNHFHDFDHFNHFDRFHHGFTHARFQNQEFNRAFLTGPRFQNPDFNRTAVFGPRFQNPDFNRSLGVPSRAIPPGAAFGGGSGAVAFIGRPGGTAGAVHGANFAMHTGGVRTGVASGARGGGHR